MITFRPTLKLARRLDLLLTDGLIPVEKPYADWCVHAFTAARSRHLIFTNTCSLLSVVTRGRGVTDENSLVRRALDVMGDYLGDTGRAFFFERFIVPEVSLVTFAPIGNRPVLGSINELVRQAVWHVEQADLSPAETSDRINESPMSLLQGRSPADVFPALVPGGDRPTG